MLRRRSYTSARGNTSFALIYGASIAILLCDILFAVTAVYPDATVNGALYACGVLRHGLYGAAALHPSMAAIDDRPISVPDRFRQRFFVVAATCLAVAAVPTTRQPFGVWDRGVRSAIMCPLLAGVLIRSERACGPSPRRNPMRATAPPTTS